MLPKKKPNLVNTDVYNPKIIDSGGVIQSKLDELKRATGRNKHEMIRTCILKGIVALEKEYTLELKLLRKRERQFKKELQIERALQKERDEMEQRVEEEIQKQEQEEERNKYE